jgi:hypothetical protein
VGRSGELVAWVLVVWSAVFLLLMFFGCSDTAGLGPPCELPCWSYDKTKRNKGICSDGTWTCKPDGSLSKCVGEVPPESELCDGLDNDCDGHVDELASLTGDAMGLVGCAPFGVCRQGHAECNAGVWDCRYPDTHQDVETLCDGLDNNCDGLIDNV